MHGRVGMLIGLAAIAAVAVAEPAPTAPTDEPAIPSLDDLLGLESDATTDANRAALNRKLNAQEAGEQFQQAVELMGDAAQRLAGGDMGLQTQRVQEDILRKLDQIIEAAQQQSSSSSSSSSS